MIRFCIQLSCLCGLHINTPKLSSARETHPIAQDDQYSITRQVAEDRSLAGVIIEVVAGATVLNTPHRLSTICNAIKIALKDAVWTIEHMRDAAHAAIGAIITEVHNIQVDIRVSALTVPRNTWITERDIIRNVYSLYSNDDLNAHKLQLLCKDQIQEVCSSVIFIYMKKVFDAHDVRQHNIYSI